MTEIPDLSRVVFRMSQREVAGEISLKPQAWRVLTAIDGTRTVADIADALGITIQVVAEIVQGLFKSGFLEIAPGSPPPPETAAEIQPLILLSKEFARAMGPMADIILDEEIEALGETRGNFPVDRFPELVERLCASIRSESKRLAFQQTMLGIIRRLQ